MSAPPRSVALARNPQFRLLWIGQIVSLTGTAAVGLAYPLLILALTHSAVIAGVVGTARAVTAIVAQLPGGALADRLDRRRALVVCDSIRCLVLTLLGAAVCIGACPWPLIALAAIVDAGGGAIFTPAVTAALPVVVADDQLEQAWALTEARSYASGLVGPALGGALFAVGRAVPFIADAATYATSALTATRLRGDFRSDPRHTTSSLRDSIRGGLSYVWSSPLLRTTLAVTPLTNFAVTGAQYTITLALRRRGVGAETVGLLQASVAAGGLAGAVLATFSLSRRPSLRQLRVGIGVGGTLLLATAALLAPSPLLVLPIALVMVPSPTFNAVLFATVLTSMPAELRGRVTSTITLTAMGLSALAPLAAGILLSHFSTQLTLAVFALAMGLSIPIGLSRRWRRAEARPPSDGAR